MDKNYGKCRDVLYPLVASRESTDPSNIVEPSFYNGNQNTDPNLGGSKDATVDKKCECKSKKK